MTVRRGQRVIEWVLFALWLGLSLLLLGADRRPPFHEGARVQVAITLVSQDANDLACASDSPVAGYWCGLTSSGQPRRHPGPELAPCVTTDHRLLLVAGLFQQDAVKQRVAQELNRVARPQQRRFVARCMVRVLKEARVPTRWHAGDRIAPPEDAWLVYPEACVVTDG